MTGALVVLAALGTIVIIGTLGYGILWAVTRGWDH